MLGFKVKFVSNCSRGGRLSIKPVSAHSFNAQIDNGEVKRRLLEQFDNETKCIIVSSCDGRDCIQQYLKNRYECVKAIDIERVDLVEVRNDEVQEAPSFSDVLVLLGQLRDLFRCHLQYGTVQ